MTLMLHEWVILLLMQTRLSSLPQRAILDSVATRRRLVRRSVLPRLIARWNDHGDSQTLVFGEVVSTREDNLPALSMMRMRSW